MSRDNNRHGESQLNPEDYSFYTWFATGVMMLDPDAIREYQRVTKELRDRSSSVYSPVGRCAHCGASIKYHVVLQDLRDGSLIAVGETCADNRFSLDQSSWKAYKDRLDEMRERARAGEKRIKLRMEFPEAMEILEAFLTEEAEGRAAAQAAWEAAGEPTETIMGTQDWFAPLRERYPSFVMDIARKMERYGNLTPGQADATVKWTAKHREKIAKRQQEDATRSPIPTFDEERPTVRVRLLSLQERSTAYGVSIKALVQHEDGWKLWGTCPRSLLEDDVTNGSIIEFNASIKVSSDDEAFGFFNRPTNASIIERKEEES